MKVRRAAFLDEYVEGGESAVLVQDQVFVLSELATTILAAVGDGTASEGRDVEEVAAVLGRVFGSPPDGVDLVEATTAAVEELASRGLLETTD